MKIFYDEGVKEQEKEWIKPETNSEGVLTNPEQSDSLWDTSHKLEFPAIAPHVDSYNVYNTQIVLTATNYEVDYELPRNIEVLALINTRKKEATFILREDLDIQDLQDQPIVIRKNGKEIPIPKEFNLELLHTHEANALQSVCLGHKWKWATDISYW